MSTTTTSDTGPRPAYVEDCEDQDFQVPPAALRPGANVAAKRSNPKIHRAVPRDVTGDSRYVNPSAGAGVSTAKANYAASPTVMESLIQQAANMMKKASGKAEGKPPVQRHVSKKHEVHNLRLKTVDVESREEAAKLQLSGPDPSTSRKRKSKKPVVENHPASVGHYLPQAQKGPAPVPIPSPAASAPLAIPRPHATASAQAAQSLRPVSYLALPPQVTYAQPPVVVIEQRPPLQPVYVQPHYVARSYSEATYLPSPTAASPTRQVAYPFPQTTMNPYFTPPSHGWPSDPYAPQHRRYSSTAQHAIMNAPYATQTSSGTTFQQAYPLPRRISGHPGERVRYSQYMPSTEEAIDLDDDRDDYQPGLMLVPPSRAVHGQQPRPAMYHARTTSDAHLAVQSAWCANVPPDHDPGHSSQISFSDEQRPPSRPILPYRLATASSINCSNVQTTAPEPPSPLRPRRRPISYYGQSDLEQQYREAEVYQSDTSLRQITTDEMYHLLKRRAKQRTNTVGSEAGSHASSSRDGSDSRSSKHHARTSLERHRPDNKGDDGFTVRFGKGNNVEIDVKGGTKERTINIKHSKDSESGMQVSLGPRPGSQPRAESRATDPGTKRYHPSGSTRSRDSNRELGEVEVASRRRRTEQ